MQPQFSKLPPSEANELESLLVAEQRDDCEASLAEYMRHAWAAIREGTPLLWNWHLDAIAEHLEAVSLGQIKRLVINMPPRYLKSLSVSVFWPTWTWAQRPSGPLLGPHLRWIFATYAQALSIDHSIDRRSLIESAWYQRRWGSRFQLTGDRNTVQEFVNTASGKMVATSVGGATMGKGGNVLVLDDPNNTQKQEGDADRIAAIRYVDKTLFTRLDDKRHGAIVVVMQRLHEKDVSGHLLGRTGNKGGYYHLKLEGEAETSRSISLPMTGRVIERKAGEPLHTEREGPDELAEAKIVLGGDGFAGQYQQRPSPAEGAHLKRKWWKFYGGPGQPACPASFEEQMQSWDCAFKDLSDSDYVVGQVWGRNGANAYLLHQVRERMDMPDTCIALANTSNLFPEASMKLVEDKANGPAVIQSMQDSVPGIIAEPVEGSKQARVAAVSPFIAAGNVWLPDPSIAPWITEFIEECAAFPKGANDDQVDAMSQALKRLIFGMGGLWAIVKQQSEARKAELAAAKLDPRFTPPGQELDANGDVIYRDGGQ